MFDKKACEICLKETRIIGKSRICKACTQEIARSALSQWLGDGPNSNNPLVNYTAKLALEARYGRGWNKENC